MPARPKRSISLPPELDEAVEAAAALQGTTFSGWLAQTAAHRLKIEAGWLGIEEWEADNGRLTAQELAEGRRQAQEDLAAAGALAAIPKTPEQLARLAQLRDGAS
ncbi:MAG: hypothetical protein JWM89_2921 [Acidimicrobiales bacterium]|nr:hypothetical protein [Acidimicrobiales bacterium]